MSDKKTSSGGQVGLMQLNCPIVLPSDAAYAMPLATTLRSIVEANPRRWPLDFHVLSDGFTETTRLKVLNSLPKGSATIGWIDVDLKFFEEFSVPQFSKMTYAKFLIPSVFPESVSRVLYLDSDLLVLDDLGPLCETDLEGAVVGAVIDGIDKHLKRGDPRFEKVPRVRDYFNTGVLIIDLVRWREDRIIEKALDYLVKNPKTPLCDQDALNVACDGIWKRLDTRWNLHYHHWDIRFADMAPHERPAVVHFVTPLKPWKPETLSLNAAFYDDFRSRTCFARTRFDKLTDKLKQLCFRFKKRS